MAKFKNKFLTINKKKIEIVRFLGSGSLGGVWEIKNELGYPKALKILYKLPQLNTKNFLEKLKILKKISHPNIMGIDTIGVISHRNLQSLFDDEQIQGPANEVPYFTMPYAAINLADYIVTHKENTLERLKLSLHLCSAIRKIHHLKVYNAKMEVEDLEHGNLKFSNLLLVTKNNTFSLKVGDLGIEPSLGIDHENASHASVQKNDDFSTTQKTIMELLSTLLQEELQNLPTVTDQNSLEVWVEKLRFFEQKMRREKSARSFLHLGIQLYSKSTYEYALKDFNKAISLDEDLYDAHLYKGLTLVEMDKLEEAKQCYQKAISLNAVDPRAYENLGDLHSSEYQNEEAVMYFQKAIDLDKNMPFCYASLGGIFKEQNMYEEALEAFSKLIEIEEDCLPAYIDRGDVHFSLEQYQNAKEDYQRAFALQDDSEEIKAKLALANEKLKGETQ
ncbi:protein kinase family protein [Candidatus Uabimicrobium sp. HlEnr_7]|uniref:protein kinase family protein n=1 Tax=Candidatus Uabimicrobium helgolandensis TaxID=3095367 RepID=UPI003557E43D